MRRCVHNSTWLIAVVLFAAACSDRSRDITTPVRIDAARVAAERAQEESKGYLVSMRDGSPEEWQAAVKAAGGQVRRVFEGINVVEVTGLTPLEAARLKSDASVETLDIDMHVNWLSPVERLSAQRLKSSLVKQSHANPGNASFYSFYQWNMRQIRANDAWTAVPSQGQGALVCVLDTGIDPNHQDLFGRVDLAKSASFVPTEPFIFDRNAHGTFVSALIAGNSIDMASVAPRSRICALKVLDENGSGDFSWLIAALMDAANKNADVVNMSLGAYFSRNEPGAKELIKSLQKAINYATDRGVLVVAAAGNDGINLDQDPPDMIHVPSQLKNVISVGATAPVNQRNFDLPTTYTNYGGKTGVDIMAPGGDLVANGDLAFGRDLILSACSAFLCGDEVTYLLGGGTSFSAPHVSAAAAVVESAFHGNARGKTLSNCILRGADQVATLPKNLYGHGRLNVLKATQCDINNNNNEDEGDKNDNS